MATWKKVIVSGSTANLAALQVDNLTTGQVVIGGGQASNLTTTAINGTGTIVATTAASGLSHSGSFSGSFTGPVTGNLTGTASFATSASNSITSSLALTNITTASIGGSTITFTKGDGTTFPISITAGVATSAGSVTMNNIATGTWYPTFVVSGSSSQSLYVNSASFSYNAATNTLSTTASFATSASFAISSSTAITASVAITASYVTGSIHTSANLALSASFAISSSAALVATTASFVTGSIFSAGNLALSSSFAISSSATLVATTASFVTGSIFSGGNLALSSSFAVTSSFASTATQVANSLTAGGGLTGTTYNGSAASTFAVGAGALISINADDVQVATSSLVTNQIPKYSANTLAGSNISDTGTQVQIAAGASSGLSVAAGGITVTGNSTFNNNVVVSGDLTVAGTASFQNTQNLLIGDRFAALASGSTTLTDGGIVVISSTTANGMSGSAFFLESTSAGTFGRWAVAANVHASASTVAADEYAVTAKINQASNPVDATPPTWGSSTNGMGNMWITNGGEIFIYV